MCCVHQSGSPASASRPTARLPLHTRQGLAPRRTAAVQSAMTAREGPHTGPASSAGDIQRKVDGWSLSLVVGCEPHRQPGDRDVGLDCLWLDWGVETFATLAYA